MNISAADYIRAITEILPELRATENPSELKPYADGPVETHCRCFFFRRI